MKARVHTDACGNITVHMEGGISYESTTPFKNEIETLMKKNPTSTITLDLNSLNFVGSSGIGIFIETLKILNEKKEQIKLANVKSEFLKVFKLYDHDDALQAMFDQFDNDDTIHLNQTFGNRSKTFLN